MQDKVWGMKIGPSSSKWHTFELHSVCTRLTMCVQICRVFSKLFVKNSFSQIIQCVNAFLVNPVFKKRKQKVTLTTHSFLFGGGWIILISYTRALTLSNLT